MRIGRTLPAIAFVCAIMFTVCIDSVTAQNDQASLLLDLKKARATYENALQKLENDGTLYENDAISETEYSQSRNNLLSAEVDYQKLMLRVIAQQSYIIVERAVKYRTQDGQRRVRVTLRSIMEGNQEYLNQFEAHFDVFTPEMQSGKVYNIFVSLVNLADDTIIGTPYEMRITSLDFGESTEADFGLLRDVESVQVALNYGGRSDKKNIYLQKDDSAEVVDVASTRFSQEADLGSGATYDLILERFSTGEDVYTLEVANLPRQVGYEFVDTDTSARLSQIKFMQGVNVRRLSLKTYLPDRVDRQVVIDRPIVFHVLALTRGERQRVADMLQRPLTDNDLDSITAGRVRLELVPRGVGLIDIRVPSLYHEITVGDSIVMDLTVRNDGTRRLDNISLEADAPMHWRTSVVPELLATLDPQQEVTARVVIATPPDGGVGAQEIAIRTRAMADNRRVESTDRIVRVQVNSETPILWTASLVMLLIGLVTGIVVFGIRISRR